MGKKIEDYLHLYLGCECKIVGHKEVDYIRMVNETGLSICTGANNVGVQLWYKSNVCKPILRPLSDITEEELKEYLSFRDAANDMGIGKYGINMGSHTGLSEGAGCLWLTKHGFDIFFLIESGLAIDKSTLNQTT